MKQVDICVCMTLFNMPLTWSHNQLRRQSSTSSTPSSYKYSHEIIVFVPTSVYIHIRCRELGSDDILVWGVSVWRDECQTKYRFVCMWDRGPSGVPVCVCVYNADQSNKLLLFGNTVARYENFMLSETTRLWADRRHYKIHTVSLNAFGCVCVTFNHTHSQSHWPEYRRLTTS